MSRSPSSRPSPARWAALTDPWLRLGMCIRLGLYPDDPGLIRIHLDLADQLAARDACRAWHVHDRCLCLLLDSADDVMLPVAWRMSCLPSCSRPMSRLGSLVGDDASAARLQKLSRRLASFSDSPLRFMP